MSILPSSYLITAVNYPRNITFPVLFQRFPPFLERHIITLQFLHGAYVHKPIYPRTYIFFVPAYARLYQIRYLNNDMVVLRLFYCYNSMNGYSIHAVLNSEWTKINLPHTNQRNINILTCPMGTSISIHQLNYNPLQSRSLDTTFQPREAGRPCLPKPCLPFLPNHSHTFITATLLLTQLFLRNLPKYSTS